MAVNIQTVGEGQSGDNDTADATGVTLHDTGGLFVTHSVQVGETVNNTTDGSSGIVTSITDNTHVVMSAGLSGGTDNEWGVGDTFTIPRDHATITLWESNTQTPTAGDTEKGQCYDDGDFLESNTCNATGTNATTNRILESAFLQGHDGTRAGAKVTVLADSGVHAFTILEKFGTFGDGMLVELQSGQGSSQECFRIGNSSENAEGTTIDGAILYNNGTQSSTDGVYAGDYNVGTSSNPIRVRNAFIFAFVRAGVHIQNWGANDEHFWEIVNCTSLDNKYNIGYDLRDATSASTIVVINTILGDPVAGGGDFITTNATELGTLTTTGSANNWDESNQVPAGTLMTLVTVAGAGVECIITSKTPYNCLLVDDADNDVLLGGVGNGSNSKVPTVDFIGNDRGTGATCDPGCHQVSAVADNDLVTAIAGTATFSDGLTGVGELTGQLTGTATVADGLTGVGELATAMVGTATVADGLTAAADNELVTAIVGTATVADGLTGVGELASQLTGTATVADGLTGVGSLTSQLACTATLADSLAGIGELATAMVGTATVADGLTGVGELATAMIGTATVSDSLTSGAGNNLVSSLVGTATLADGLTGIGGLTSQLSGTATVSDGLSGAGALTTAMVGTASMVDSLVGAGVLATAMVGTASVTDNLTGIGVLSTALVATATLADSLTGIGVLTSAMVATATLLSDLVDGNSLFLGPPLDLSLPARDIDLTLSLPARDVDLDLSLNVDN